MRDELYDTWMQSQLMEGESEVIRQLVTTVIELRNQLSDLERKVEKLEKDQMQMVADFLE